MVVLQPVTHPEVHQAIKERDEALEGFRGVSVCVTYFNEDLETVSRAVRSAVEQTVPPLEIFVIDDGSDNKLPESWSTMVQVVRITNRGLPAARNVGLMLACGHAFLPLDADDWLAPDYLEKTLPLLEEADVVLTGLQEHGPTRNGCYMPGYDRPHHLVTVDTLWEFNRFYYCSLFRTDLLRAVGGYNPRMAGGWGVSGGYEDWDLWIDLKSRDARFAAVNEPLFHYTTKPESMLMAAERNRGVLVDEMKRHHRVPLPPPPESRPDPVPVFTGLLPGHLPGRTYVSRGRARRTRLGE